MKRIIFTIALFTAIKASAQVGIGTTTPDASAILDLTSAAKGLLIPRLTALEVAGLTSPARGLLIYQTNGTAGFYYNSGTPASPVWNYMLTNKTSIPTANVSGDVELAPTTEQPHTTDGSPLINLRMLGNTDLGNAGSNRLISISDSARFIDGNTYDGNRFAVEADGSILSNGIYNSGLGGCPQEGSGNRFMWYAGKASLRAGGIDGTQWDDANIGLYSTAFGQNVRALGDNATAMGKSCVAAGSRTIAMGEGCTATGYASVALGYGASSSTSVGSPRNGTFVFSDFSVPLVYSFGSSVDASTQFHPSVTNSFNVRAVNGTFMYTNTALTTGLTFNSTTANLTLNNSRLAMASDGSTTIYSNAGSTSGVTISAGGGTWNSISDRRKKENFRAVNGEEVLQKVAALKITNWNYKAQPMTQRHVGPMAQDFYAAFQLDGIGNDTTINTGDIDGVNMIAIQALEARTKELKTENDDLKVVNKVLMEQLATLQQQSVLVLRRLDAIEGKETPATAERPIKTASAN